MNDIYKQFQVIRKQKGYTLKSLSEATGIPFQRISSIENGQFVPKKEYCKKLEQVLGIDLFSNTEEDQKILGLFDDFCIAIFYGTLQTKELNSKVNEYFDSHIESKFYYLVYVMKYAFEVLAGNERNMSEKPLLKIGFDKRAFQIYQTYKAISLYERGKLEQAGEILNNIINTTTNEKMRCFARYQLIFVLIDQYKLHEAHLNIEKAKRVFFEHQAYIRVLKCNIHLANVYACQHRYAFAVQLYEKCIQGAVSLNLPYSEITYLYRNIALYHIYNHSYSDAIAVLEKAYSLEPRNERACMYYLYAYYFLKDLDKFNYWLKECRKYVHSPALKVELDFWENVGRKKFEVTSKLIEKAVKVYDYYEKRLDYDVLFFYSELIVSLYEQNNDEKNEYLFYKKTKKILSHMYNS